LNARRRVPYVTLLLIAGNLAAAFAVLVQPDLVATGGFKASDPSLQTALSSLFLQANLLHLLGNMVFLAAVGASVELATGSVRYLLVFFLSGVCGIVAHTIMATGVERTEPLIGASGCVAGLIGYYSARYMGMKVPVAPKVSVSVAAVTGLWLILQIAGTLVHISGDTSISYWSHIGGFACGLLLSVVFRTPDLGQHSLSLQRLDEMNMRSPAMRLEAAKLHLSKHPKDLRGAREWVEAAHVMDDHGEEIAALLTTLRLLPAHPPSLERLCEMGEIGRLSVLERRHVADKIKATDPDLAATILITVLAEPVDSPHRPEALLELVKLRWDTKRQEAQGYLSDLETNYAQHGALEVARRIPRKD